MVWAPFYKQLMLISADSDSFIQSVLTLQKRLDTPSPIRTGPVVVRIVVVDVSVSTAVVGCRLRMTVNSSQDLFTGQEQLDLTPPLNFLLQ